MTWTETLFNVKLHLQSQSITTARILWLQSFSTWNSQRGGTALSSPNSFLSLKTRATSWRMHGRTPSLNEMVMYTALSSDWCLHDVRQLYSALVVNPMQDSVQVTTQTGFLSRLLGRDSWATATSESELHCWLLPYELSTRRLVAFQFSSSCLGHRRSVVSHSWCPPEQGFVSCNVAHGELLTRV